MAASKNGYNCYGSDEACNWCGKVFIPQFRTVESKNGRTRQIQTSTAKQNLEYHILSTHSEEIAAEKKERDRLAGMVGHSLSREQPNNFCLVKGFFEMLRALFVACYFRIERPEDTIDCEKVHRN